VKGNFHARFLGEGKIAISFPYPIVKVELILFALKNFLMKLTVHLLLVHLKTAALLTLSMALGRLILSGYYGIRL